MECPKCKAELSHVHDTAYGLPEIHMSGSERFECTKCDFVCDSQKEGTEYGLVFILDK